ncbi:helix-turn-helix domain-containing protein [Sphingobacterium phlebotomi]|uniref:Helix-turn-helix domain-containing protein n=1 Tax=Sphingobacterium phlebotomi TaxID=2605433 RepID=A0A5D4H9W8_9SPHI|nr:helix-turn-helix domain-containing protein [Sphingobacterium phlebotomi]TYR37394.1 helix-turn-helix domain-containing protein [Sphingobacterium phlebotomi]
MKVEIITKEDLLLLKAEIVSEIKELLIENTNRNDERQWLRSGEVRKMLNISPGTLQNLRINGALPYKKLGGIIYYRRKDIESRINGGLTDE